MIKKFLGSNPNFDWKEFIKNNKNVANRHKLNSKKKVLLFLLKKDKNISNSYNLINKKHNIIKKKVGNPNIIKNKIIQSKGLQLVNTKKSTLKNIIINIPNNFSLTGGSTTFSLNTIKIFLELGFKVYFIDKYNTNIKNLVNDTNFFVINVKNNFKLIYLFQNIINKFKINYIFTRNLFSIKELNKYLSIIKENKICNFQFVWSNYPNYNIQNELIKNSDIILVSNYILLDKIRKNFKNKRICIFLPIINDINKTVDFKIIANKKINRSTIYNSLFLEQIVENNEKKKLLKNFFKNNKLNLDYYTRSKDNFINSEFIQHKNLYNNINLSIILSKYTFGFLFRTKKYEKNNDISCKIIEWMFHGIIPIVNKHPINKVIFGDNYRFEIDNLNDILNFDDNIIKNTRILNYNRIKDLMASKSILRLNGILNSEGNAVTGRWQSHPIKNKYENLIKTYFNIDLSYPEIYKNNKNNKFYFEMLHVMGNQWLKDETKFKRYITSNNKREIIYNELMNPFGRTETDKRFIHGLKLNLHNKIINSDIYSFFNIYPESYSIKNSNNISSNKTYLIKPDSDTVGNGIDFFKQDTEYNKNNVIQEFIDKYREPLLIKTDNIYRKFYIKVWNLLIKDKNNKLYLYINTNLYIYASRYEYSINDRLGFVSNILGDSTYSDPKYRMFTFNKIGIYNNDFILNKNNFNENLISNYDKIFSRCLYLSKSLVEILSKKDIYMDNNLNYQFYAYDIQIDKKFDISLLEVNDQVALNSTQDSIYDFHEDSLIEIINRYKNNSNENLIDLSYNLYRIKNLTQFNYKKIVFIGNTDYAYTLTRLSNTINKYSTNFRSVVIVCSDNKYYNIDDYPYSNKVFLNNNLSNMMIEKIKLIISKADYIFWNREEQEVILLKDYKFIINSINLNKNCKKLLHHQGLNYYKKHQLWDKKKMPLQNHVSFDEFVLMNGIYGLSTYSIKKPFHPGSFDSVKLIKKNKLINIYHHGTNRLYKGTDLIIDVLNEIKNNNNVNIKVNTDNIKIKNKDCLKYLESVDIYIDWISRPEISNAGLGISSFEAMSKGCVIITNSEYLDEYCNFFGIEKPPILIVNHNKKKLYNTIEKLIKNPNNLRNYQINSLKWINNYFNRENSIKYIQKIFN